MHNIENVDKENSNFVEKCRILLKKLFEMAMLLIKMAVQCIDFVPYSPSTLVISSIYSSTAFLKHSKSFGGQDTNRFITEVRKIIFQVIEEELR